MKIEEIKNSYKLKYLKINPEKGYPFSKDYYYECLICGEILFSQPEKNISCSCGNIFIDVDEARFSVRDNNMIKLFKVK